MKVVKKLKNRIVEIVNSDWKIIKIFLSFLKKIGIPNKKLRGRVCVHENQKGELERITKYWSKLTNIPLS